MAQNPGVIFMARTITITDDEQAVQASVVIHPGEGDSPPRVSSIHIDAINGGTITSADLLLLESVGLALPRARTPIETRTIEPPAAPVAASVPTGRQKMPRPRADGLPPAPTLKPVQTGGRTRWDKPADPAIVEAFGVLKSPIEVARYFGVPRKVAQNWVTRLRSKGLLPAVEQPRARRRNG